MTETEVKHSTGDVGQSVSVDSERSWADVHGSILFEIFSRLFAHDRTMFRLVCKSWSSALPIKTRCKFKGNNTLECPSPLLMLPKNIFHPIHEEFYPVEFPDIPGAQIQVAKDDWLLFRRPYLRLFFYNPFTKVQIMLPDLLDAPKSMYFSSPPMSSDWMVLVTRTGLTDEGCGIIVVDTITCGEEIWSTCKFVQKDDFFELSCCNVVSCKGLCYFLGSHGRLMIHDPKNKKFYFYDAPESIHNLLIDVREQYLLESDGKIFTVFVGIDGSWLRVCRWNSSKRKWEVLEKLGNKSFFVCRQLSICETVTAKGMGNKIYFPRLVDDHCVFYSLRRSSILLVATLPKHFKE